MGRYSSRVSITSGRQSLGEAGAFAPAFYGATGKIVQPGGMHGRLRGSWKEKKGPRWRVESIHVRVAGPLQVDSFIYRLSKSQV